MRPAALDAALAEADAGAFVHAGLSGDPTIRLLSGASILCEAAIVYEIGGDESAGTTTLVPARSLPDRVESRVDATVLEPTSTPGARAAEYVADHDADQVLVPRSVPHDTALFLERAGVEVASTEAHLETRERKTDDELGAVEDAQTAAAAGMAAAATLLADADTAASGVRLEDDDGPVTAERVRRAANTAMAAAGANPAGNTIVLGDIGAAGDDCVLPASSPIAVRVSPRVRGYHGLLARTFVADSDGGWERRATLACERAIDMGVDFVDPGETTAAAVAGEVTAELGSYGFPPASASGDAYGVGLERRERPVGDDTLGPGAVVALEPKLDGENGDSENGDSENEDGENGGGDAERSDTPVWLADLAVVTEDGAELLGSFPRSVVPRPVDAPSP